LSTTNPTSTGPESNPGLRSGRPSANRLSQWIAVNTYASLLLKFLRVSQSATKFPVFRFMF
jgi:hypothetical protein